MGRNYQRLCQSWDVIECVVNVSEGRDSNVLAELDHACGNDLLDRHSDADHHRSVFTLIDVAAPRRLAARAIELLRIDRHEGAHPRLGVVDVVPFVPLSGSTFADAVSARDEFATWIADTFSVPCFLYGTERSLPDIRRNAWARLSPDVGPSSPHPTAGAVCVGARDQLVAYNCWLDERAGIDDARHIARAIRSTEIRALGLMVGDRVQVSMNLVSPMVVGPFEAERLVTEVAERRGVMVERNELVGLLSRDVLSHIPTESRRRLDVADDRTIEYRVEIRQ